MSGALLDQSLGMTQQKPIADLAQAFPKLAAAVTSFLEAVSHSERGSHVGMVVTATAILEHDLGRCLLTMMPGINRAHRDKLFSGYGPVSSFSAKIDLAYALGVIDKRCFTEIHKLRQIRNKMAHSTNWRGLQEEPFASLLGGLDLPPGTPAPDATFGSHARAFMVAVIALDEELERFLVAKGVTEDISLLAPALSRTGLNEILTASPRQSAPAGS